RQGADRAALRRRARSRCGDRLARCAQRQCVGRPLDCQFPQRRLPMKTRAAVAFAARQPLEIVEVDLDGPKAGEVLVEIMATGICHTDAYTLDGFDSEGIFPSIL